MTLEEIQDRVAASLKEMNSQGELYDWRLTHFNELAWKNILEGSRLLAGNRISAGDLKSLIGVYRDKCHVAFIDFRIKALEPGPGEFERMNSLFGPLTSERLIPPRGEGERRAYLQVKTLDAMRLTLEHKQPVSDKLRQQFNWLMVRAERKAPELMAVAVELESYNPFQKRLTPAPTVNLEYHLTEEQKEMQESTPPPEPMFGSDAVDNSSFEARLAPAPVKTERTKKSSPWAEIYKPSAEQMPIEVTYNPPAEIHEEFAAYCQNLYEKAKGN